MGTKRSLVRVKIWILVGIFMFGWLRSFLGLNPADEVPVDFWFSLVASSLLFAVRCEQCHRHEFHVLDWKRNTNPFLPKKHCPECGMERV